MRRDRQLEQQGLACLPRQIEPSTIVKHHVVVALQVRLVATGSGAGALREHLERDIERHLVTSQAANAFQPGRAPDPTANRDALPVALDLEVPSHTAGPAFGGQPHIGRVHLRPYLAGPLGQLREVYDE